MVTTANPFQRTQKWLKLSQCYRYCGDTVHTYSECGISQCYIFLMFDQKAFNFISSQHKLILHFSACIPFALLSAFVSCWLVFHTMWGHISSQFNTKTLALLTKCKLRFFFLHSILKSYLNSNPEGALSFCFLSGVKPHSRLCEWEAAGKTEDVRGGKGRGVSDYNHSRLSGENQLAPAAGVMKCWQLPSVLKSTSHLFERGIEKEQRYQRCDAKRHAS